MLRPKHSVKCFRKLDDNHNTRYDSRNQSCPCIWITCPSCSQQSSTSDDFQAILIRFFGLVSIPTHQRTFIIVIWTILIHFPQSRFASGMTEVAHKSRIYCSRRHNVFRRGNPCMDSCASWPSFPANPLNFMFFDSVLGGQCPSIFLGTRPGGAILVRGYLLPRGHGVLLIFLSSSSYSPSTNVLSLAYGECTMLGRLGRPLLVLSHFKLWGKDTKQRLLSPQPETGFSLQEMVAFIKRKTYVYIKPNINCVPQAETHLRFCGDPIDYDQQPS